MEALQAHLDHAFETDATARAQNANGQLAEAQIAVLRERIALLQRPTRRANVAIGATAVAFLLAGVVLGNGEVSALAIVPLAVLAVTWSPLLWVNFWFRQDARAGRVETLEGQVGKEERYGRQSPYGQQPAYFISIENRAFLLTPAQYDALDEQTRYRLHYLPRSNWLVAAERLSETGC